MQKIFGYLIVSLLIWMAIYNVKVHKSFPRSFQIEGVHCLLQPDDITCGPTSAAMAINLIKSDSITVEDVAQKAATEWFEWDGKKIGMTAPDLLTQAIKSFSVSAHLKRGFLWDLKYYVSQNKPVIVLLRSGKTTWHYVVVVGYDDKTITVADPGYGKFREMPEQTFKTAWAFASDMRGNDIRSDCKFCNGSGKWMNYELGPLSQCVFCDGSGKNVDVLTHLLRSAEVFSNTLIVVN